MQYQVCFALLLWPALLTRAVAQDTNQIIVSISQIASQYLQATQLPDIAAALVSAVATANDTTPFTQVLQSVILGPPLSYITAVLSAYQTQIVSIESALSVLQDALISSAQVAASGRARLMANITATSFSGRTLNATSSKTMAGTLTSISSSVAASTASSAEMTAKSYTAASLFSVLPSSISGASQASLPPYSTTSSTQASKTSLAVFTGAASRLAHEIAGILGLLGLAIAL